MVYQNANNGLFLTFSKMIAELHDYKGTLLDKYKKQTSVVRLREVADHAVVCYKPILILSDKWFPGVC